MSKALEMLKLNKTVAERAESYLDSIKRNLQKEVIDKLIERKDTLRDQIFSLTDVTLQTNINLGVSAITREAAQANFKKLMDAEYELEILTLELEARQDIFNKYFVVEEEILPLVATSKEKKVAFVKED